MISILFSYSLSAQDCNSLKKKGESYGAGDNSESWCDFEKQTAYVKCMCDRESNYQNQLAKQKSIGEKYNADFGRLRENERNAYSSGDIQGAINYLDQRISLVKQNPTNSPQWALDRELTTLKSQRREYEGKLKEAKSESKDTTKEIKVGFSDNTNSKNTTTSINSFETNYEVYNKGLQSAVANSFDNEGNMDVASFVSNLPQATNKTQAYTNVAATGLAIAGQLMQQRQARLEREGRVWKAKLDAWKEMYKSVKDGVGSRNGQGKKTGTWIYFNDLFLISDILTYKNGKVDGIALSFRKLRTNGHYFHEDFHTVFTYHPTIYKDGKKNKTLPMKFLWKKKIKEPDFYVRVSKRTQGFNRFYEREGKNLDLGYYNSSDLDFTKKRRFSVKTKIELLNYATYDGKSFPIGLFQLLNRNNVSIQEGLYNGKGQKIGNWFTFNPNDTYPKYDKGSNTDPIEKISYSEGKKQGKYYSQFWEGQFSSDRKVGLWKNKQDSGLTIKFSSDGHTGLQEKKNNNGKIIEKAIVYDTKYNGEYQSFYSNGNLKSKGEYKDNKKIGEWNFYNENGEIVKSQVFKEEIKPIIKSNSRLPEDADYAIIYFYRPEGFFGWAFSGKIKGDGDVVVTTVGKGEVVKYKTKEFGKNSFWISNYQRKRNPVLIDIVKGQEYFLKIGDRESKMKVLEVFQVDNEIGLKESKSLEEK
tara:strand:- start:1108 stop:3201 length:2094 start_codon:yes stop_codon:yes gene_type:complete